MRRFRFRLQSLLRLRSQIERSARRDLAAAMAEVNVLDQRLAAAAQGLQDCAAQAADTGAAGKLARSLEVGLRRHEWRLRTDQQKAQRKVDVVRVDYVGKARDLRTLQRLREQRQAEWRQAATKSEQAELDELARLARAANLAAEESGGEEA
jgi:flagellar export protein FliJ